MLINRREKGYVLITTALLLTAVVAVSGLSFDLGRMYVARNEAQVFADAGALAAAKALNGTVSGLNTARTAAASMANRYNFNTQSFSNVSVTFSTSANGPWDAAPASAANVAFARVIAVAPTNIYLMTVGGSASTSNPAAVAVAGQIPQTLFREGIFPFSPFSINSTPPDFGLTVCNAISVPGCETSFYALRWPPGAFNNEQAMQRQGNNIQGNVCPGDLGQVTVAKATEAAADIRGYFGPYGNADTQRESIINDEVPPGLDVTVGTNLPMNGGAMQTQGDAILQRVNQDTDSTSRTYNQYLSHLDGNGNRVGNGRRVIGVPINSGPPNFTVLGIAGFFLLDSVWYQTNGNQPFCAEYIGPFVLGGGGGGAYSSGAYVVRLVQ
jgi:Flp pilus assembly protein TadG